MKSAWKGAALVAVCVAIGMTAAWWNSAGNLKEANSGRSQVQPRRDGESQTKGSHDDGHDKTGLAVAKAKRTNARLETYVVPSGNVVDVFNRLKARADAGDAVAAFGIYQKLRQCAQLPRRGMDDGLAEAYAKTGAGDEFLKSIEQQTRECAGATALLKKEHAGAWLERAADQGAVIAQLVYAADQETVLGTSMDMIKDPEGLIRYKQKAMGYLERAAATGSSDALFQLADAYSKGFYAKENADRAYAYAYAAAKQSGSTAAQQLLQRYSRGMAEEQITQARKEGQRIFDRCCGSNQ